MNRIFISAALLASLFLTGCASITGTTGQSLSVQTKKGQDSVADANCELINSKGQWFIKTPGSIPINRSNDDLIVTCKKDGMDHGVANVVSDTKPGMFGNIIFGGGIGAIIDHNTGAAYEYPTLVTVFMGETTTIKTPPQSSDETQKQDEKK